MKFPLLVGAYQSRSVLSEAQRCVNLYMEHNPQDSPFPTTHYPRPGLKQLVAPTVQSGARGMYTATTGQLFACLGSTLYYVDPTWTLHALGMISTIRTPVSMTDNGINLILVDGTPNVGYQVNMQSMAFSLINDMNFLGGVSADYLDTFLLFSVPGTQDFISSLSNEISFDPTYIAGKTGRADLLQGLITVKREIWLIGTLSTEVWYDAGNAQFPFAALPGILIEHGTIAKRSIARWDKMPIWLGQDSEGVGMVFIGENYTARRISTHALEVEFQGYSTLVDCIGYTYQIGGHVFYKMVFPTADKSWVYDFSTEQWYQDVWIDNNGEEHRSRGCCAASAYGIVLEADWQTGAIYKLDSLTFTDNGDPIKFLRSWPHLVIGMDRTGQPIAGDGKRIQHTRFQAEMECGSEVIAGFEPQVQLKWSDDRGKTWGTPLFRPLGGTGKFLAVPQWRNLGIARDRVFEISWSANVKTALNGAYCEPRVLGT